MAQEEKLDWIYKGANSLVNREDYLLGKKIDKSLEQLNEDEKPRKIVLPTPKNHVEHECIPPSIRDFNKIVQGEQVDMSAKLQEDPLVAIRKQEEEARRQFLQNPVQLKKLQDALMKKEELKNKKLQKKKKLSSLDEKIKAKLLKLKVKTPTGDSKVENDDVLNTILMHKFNALKSKLSDDDLKDIMEGKVDDSESDVEKSKKKPDSSSSSDSDYQKKSKKKKITKSQTGRSIDNRMNRQRNRSRSRDHDRRNKSSTSRRRSRSRSRDHPERRDDSRRHKSSYVVSHSKIPSSDVDLDEKIMSQLKALRGKSERKERETKRKMLPEKPAHLKSKKFSSSSSSSSNSLDSESEDERPQRLAFGLVTSDGKKLQFKNKPEKYEAKKMETVKKIEPPKKNQTKRLTEQEKEKRRNEMMQSGKVRDKQREETVRKYRENEKKEQEQAMPKEYDADLVQAQLMKTAKHTSMEERLKSKLNTIQRSSRYMDQNFSKR